VIRPKPFEPKRNAMVTIRFLPEERDRVKDLAQEAGVSMSDWGRAKMLGEEPSRGRRRRPRLRPALPVPEVNREVAGALTRGFSNLNQLTHAVNRGDAPPLRELHEDIAALKVLMKEGWFALMGGKA
jgi:hypothetical protein